MTDKEFNALYNEVKRLSTTGEVAKFDSVTTSLYDWMKEGDCEGMTASQIAAEWDSLDKEPSENNTKDRSQQLAIVARAIADRHPDHVLNGGKLLPLAREMMTETGCNVDTAKRHIAKQFRLMRGELVKQWGGSRPGAGRPPNE